MLAKRIGDEAKALLKPFDDFNDMLPQQHLAVIQSILVELSEIYLVCRGTFWPHVRAFLLEAPCELWSRTSKLQDKMPATIQIMIPRRAPSLGCGNLYVFAIKDPVWSLEERLQKANVESVKRGREVSWLQLAKRLLEECKSVYES